MRSKTCTVALAASVALLLAGCADNTVAGHGQPAVAAAVGSGGATAGSSSSAAAGTSAAAGSGVAHTTAELQAGLLTIDDLSGTGWAVEPSDDNSDDNSDDSTCGADDPGDQANEAEADFSQGETGPFFFEQVYSAPSAAAAKAAYAKLVTTLSSCSGTTQSDGSSATITDMSFPKVGDQSHGYRLLDNVPDESTSPGDDSIGQTIPADIVVVQDGALLEEFVYIDLTGTGIANLPTDVKTGVTRAHQFR